MAILSDDDGEEWKKQKLRESRLNTGCNGAHTVIPFQCEICWIRNLTGREMELPRDEGLRKCLRRANLDALSGRAKSTIESHLRGVNTMLELSDQLGKPPSIEATPRGPMPEEDLVGMSLAVEMLQKSITAKGRIKWHIQFDTMRKLRSTFSCSWDSSPLGIKEGSSFSKGIAKVRITSCPSQSQWFTNFLLGAQDRMGYDTNNQLALSIKCIVTMLDMIKTHALEMDDTYARRLYKTGALVTILTAASLRGYEGFYLDLAATRNHIAKGREGSVPKGFKRNHIITEDEAANLPSVCICLLGKFKGETGERYHSIILPNNTMSGLDVRWWVEKLLEVCQEEGRTSGPAFDEPDGSPPNSSEYNAIFRQYLCLMQVHHPKLFGPDEDVTRYGTSRTLRKAATGRFSQAGLSETLIDAMCRWNTVEKAQGRRPKHNMRNHYTDARALAPLTWRCGYVI